MKSMTNEKFVKILMQSDKVGVMAPMSSRFGRTSNMKYFFRKLYKRITYRARIMRAIDKWISQPIKFGEPRDLPIRPLVLARGHKLIKFAYILWPRLKKS
jgi:hypothetical protein